MKLRTRRESYLKPRDSWFDVLAWDHLSVPITETLRLRGWATPNRVTMVGTAAKLFAVLAHLHRRPRLGGALFFTGVCLDGLDGKLARVRGVSSPRGAALDFSTDVAIIPPLMYAQAKSSGTSTTEAIAAAAAAIGSSVAGTFTSTASAQAGKFPHRWDRWMEDRRLAPVPTIVDLQVAAFCLTPALAPRLTNALFRIYLAHATATWVIKLRSLADKDRTDR